MDGQTRVFENAAICLYLGDTFPEAHLAPRIGAPERGRYLSLVVYSTSQLEPSMGDVRLNVQTQPQRGWTDYPTALNVIEHELGQGPWLFGDWFTSADIMIGSIFIYMRVLGVRSDRPAIEAYVDRLMTRPRCMKLG